MDRHYLLYIDARSVGTRCLEAKRFLDKDDLDTVRIERVGLPDNIVVHDSRRRDTVCVASASTLCSKSKLLCSLVGFHFVLDNLVGSNKDNHIGSTKGNASDL